MTPKASKKSSPAKSAPVSPDKAIQEMMETINALRTIYVNETNALNASDTKAFLELQTSKLEAAQIYQQRIEALLERKEDIKSASPLLKKRLNDLHSEFSVLTEKNVEALKRMQRSTQRLGETIMNSAKEAARQQRIFAYSENGAIRGGEKRTLSMGLTETA